MRRERRWFATEVPILYDPLMYPSGKPPVFLRRVEGVQRQLTLGMGGSWSIQNGGPNTSDQVVVNAPKSKGRKR